MTTMSPGTLGWLFLAGFAGGFIDAIASGGLHGTEPPLTSALRMDLDSSHLNPPDPQAALCWAETEFATLDCGDPRRNRRFVRVASDFVRNPTAAIPAACRDWAGTKACHRLFDQPEVNSGAPPEQAPATREAGRMIARLGGFLGRKGDGEPGPEVLWRGLTRLRTLGEAWRTFKPQSCG